MWETVQKGEARGGTDRLGDFAPIVGRGKEIAHPVESSILVVELEPGTPPLGTPDSVFDQPLSAVLVQ